VSFENLSSETVGEIEVERKVLVIKRIKQTFHLETDEGDRETVERVLEVYAEGCPVARSVRDSIEITSELDFT
jgi:organic hydroperoxide reductase OsmC/OhrA